MSGPADLGALRPPEVVWKGRRWTSSALSADAWAWLAALPMMRRRSPSPVALVMTSRPGSVALLFALSALPGPVVLLPPDPRHWRPVPPLPPGTTLVLPPDDAGFAPPAAALGLEALVLGAPPALDPAGPQPSFLQTPALVFLTSGSTGPPRPVARPPAVMVGAGRALIQALGLRAGEGVVGTLPCATHYGLAHTVVAATLLGGPLGLVERFEPHAVLDLFAEPRYAYWPGTPVTADLLGRAGGPPRHAAPRICVVNGPPAAAIQAAFTARFGTALRQCYGTTESGALTVDGAEPGAVRSETVGRPVPGVEIRVGDDPGRPLMAGLPGPVWIRTPWYMAGYGYPPDLELPPATDGWRATRDLGRLDATGHLTLLGRVDDGMRTAAGHLVDLAQVAAALTAHPGVREAVVLPVDGPGGPRIGAVIECDAAVAPVELRRHAAARLPGWAQPSVLTLVRELPRLPGGKVDRRACRLRLQRPAAMADGGP